MLVYTLERDPRRGKQYPNIIVSLQWDYKSAIMMIGMRQGENPSMPREQDFRIALVDGAKTGLSNNCEAGSNSSGSK
jgi:hypothetical protein